MTGVELKVFSSDSNFPNPTRLPVREGTVMISGVGILDIRHTGRHVDRILVKKLRTFTSGQAQRITTLEPGEQVFIKGSNGTRLAILHFSDEPKTS